MQFFKEYIKLNMQISKNTFIYMENGKLILVVYIQRKILIVYLC